MSATAVEAYALDPLRDRTHLGAKSGRELSGWLTWLEYGGFGSRDAYERTVAVLLNMYPTLAFDEFTDTEIGACLMSFPAKSRRIRKAHLNNWFAWGYRTKRIPVNPVDFLPKVRQTPQPIIDVFTETEQAQLEAYLYLTVR